MEFATTDQGVMQLYLYNRGKSRVGGHVRFRNIRIEPIPGE